MFQKKRYFLSIFFCLLFLILCSLPGILPEHAAGDALNTSVSFDLPQTLSEPRVPSAVIDPSVQPSLTLYAKSAVLMDAESGRILYEKNGYEILPMASTTKIMTCILALENGDLNDYAEVSSYASGMPKVHLGARSGEFFRLEDLLYSLMLESHNDSAVIIAEHIAGSTGEFADMMNRKARKIGCDNTFFITPNGLDAVSTSTDGQTHIHSTTAADLARIMSYCITSSPKKEEFLTITRTASHSFTGFQKSGEDYVSDGRTFTCNNHNAFLSMMEGALSGKTGFTANAGYCYAGSLRQEDRTFVVALLACGWPNNKSYKWSDTKKLMSYGLENYTTHTLQEALLSSSDLPPVPVCDGAGDIWNAALSETPYIKRDEAFVNKKILLKQGEHFQVQYEYEKTLTAPVRNGQKIGEIRYYLDDTLYYKESIHVPDSIDAITLPYCIRQSIRHFLLYTST